MFLSGLSAPKERPYWQSYLGIVPDPCCPSLQWPVSRHSPTLSRLELEVCRRAYFAVAYTLEEFGVSTPRNYGAPLDRNLLVRVLHGPYDHIKDESRRGLYPHSSSG